jgi:hypothetical protein
MDRKAALVRLSARPSATWLRALCMLSVLLSTAVIVAQANGLVTWQDGQTLKASDLNANFSYLDGRITTLMNTPPRATAADAEALPRRLFRVIQNEACTVSGPSETAHYADCTCASGEVAISGGGFCGLDNAVIENAALNVNNTRLSTVWRLQCEASNPLNFYALCLKVSP